MTSSKSLGSTIGRVVVPSTTVVGVVRLVEDCVRAGCALQLHRRGWPL